MKNTFHLNFSTADHLGIGLFKYNLYPREKFIVTNSTLPQMLGHSSPADFKKTKLNDLFFDPKDWEEFSQILRKSGKVIFFEALFKNKENNPLWVAITASKITLKNESECLEGIIENISGHKAVEEKLAIEKDFLRGLLDNMPDAVYFKDRNNRIVKVNKYYAQGVGLRPEEIIGKSDFDFFPQEQAKRMFDDDNKILETGIPIVGKIERTLLPDGRWNQVITTKIPMYEKSGKIIGTMGITRDMTAYANTERERLEMLVNALRVVGKTLEMRDPYTFSHMRRVAKIAGNIAGQLGWDENRLLGLKLSAELHDLGKMSVPLEILNKPGKLSELEYRFIQEHVAKCYDIVIQFPFPFAETIYQHHELLDGSGYPRRLKADQIILEARILTISDVLEAMTHHRPYRQAVGVEAAGRELTEGRGVKYDSKIVDIVFALIAENGGKAFWMNGT